MSSQGAVRPPASGPVWDRWRATPAAAQLAVAVLALLALLGLGAWLVRELQGGDDAVRRTLAIDRQLSEAFSLLQDAETGQRGYLLTGDATYLAPYAAAVASLDARIAELRAALGENGAQAAALATFEALAHEKLAELRRTVEQRQSGAPEAALALLRAGSGKAVMDEIRKTVEAMDRAEGEHLLRQLAETERTDGWLRLTAVAIVAAIFLLAALSVGEIGRRAALARFLPAELVHGLASSAGSLRRGGRREVAILFVDLRDSTARAERMDPDRFVDFLSAFRARVTQAARRHGGVVDKFMGDGALLVFGLPQQQGDEAARALACAHTLLALVQAWNAEGGHAPAVGIGIGVHHGRPFCGVVGGAGRLEFTVIGDAVNVAARLEQATRRLGSPILASRAVVQAAGELDRWTELGQERLRGRRGGTVIMRPATLAAHAVPAVAAEG
ncbi:MAG: CHASE3 domain-containing protein [Geminicoccaceae bacterium]